VIFGTAEADVEIALAGLRDGRTRGGAMPSAGVGGCDFRFVTILILGAEEGVRRDGDMVEGMVPPGVAAEGVDAETDAVPNPLILRVSRFCGGGGG
jgi:hypothetical protein